MSGLPPLVGHDDLRHSLGAAVQHGDLPGSLLFHGSVGIGKQRLALWLAQRLVCEAPNGAEPCNTCHSCHLVTHLEHPDVHWFFPLPRPKSGGSREKLGEALEEARAAELEVRRAEPYRAFLPGEPVGLYVSQMQILRRMAVARPAMGQRKVFIIGAAENLVSQEASTEAANALLKVLEEPPADTVFILTANDPDELLPTIRSRLLPLRVQPLSQELVASVVGGATGVDERQANLAARLSEGSIGRALAFLPNDGAPGQLEEVRIRARELLEIAVQSKPASRLAAALAVGPAGARGVFADTLDFLALWIRDLAAVASGALDLVVNIDATEHLRGMAGRLPVACPGAPLALRSIDLARGMTRSNLNPQLTLAWLLREIGQALRE
jgi:DNA polymerase III subunit delta'